MFRTTQILRRALSTAPPPPPHKPIKKVGWIGLGVMGSSMAQHVAGAGYELHVFARDPSKESVSHVVQATGAEVHATPAELAAHVDAVCAIVGTPDDVRDVFLHPETGVLAGGDNLALVVDLTTSTPSLAKEIAEAAGEMGIGAVDAPVSGGDVGARNGTLSVMVGGEERDVEAASTVLHPMAGNVTHMGGPGSGQHTKMVNQIAIAGGMIGMTEALVYGHAAGLDLETVLTAISGGAAGSWSLDNYAPRMLDRDFEPGFVVEHFVKDMGIALDEAQAMSLALPGLALVKQLYLALVAQGGGRMGTHALQLALESLNNIQVSKPPPAFSVKATPNL